MTPEEMRLKCLELAVEKAYDNSQILPTANAFYQFVTGAVTGVVTEIKPR